MRSRDFWYNVSGAFTCAGMMLVLYGALIHWRDVSPVSAMITGTLLLIMAVATYVFAESR